MERFDQPLDVLVRLDVARVQHERLVQLEALADAMRLPRPAAAAGSDRRWRCG